MQDAPAATRPTNAKVLTASVVGSAIEWFDYFLYGTLAAVVFSKLYFPVSDPVVAVMLAYLTFALTFFVRPIGGMFFSFLGDKVGRKKTLVITLSLMGAATCGIGLLPTYDQIGLLAPALLIFLRLVQGVGIGGEWGGALLLAYEYAPRNKRGLFGSLPQAGITIGMLLSTVSVSLVSLLPEESFMSWGWRLPFLLSAGLVLVGLWIRKGVDETPEFKAMKEAKTEAKNPLTQTLRHHWRAVLTAILAKVVETGPFYIFTVFIVSYTTGALELERLTALNAVTVGALISVVTIPLSGALSDRFGRRAVFLAGCALMALFAAPYFMLLDMRTPMGVMIATAIAMGLIWPMLTAVLGTLFSEIFTTDVRYTGVTIGYQAGAALAGGTAPLIATWLLATNNNQWGPIAVYIAATAIISAVAVIVGGKPKT
jgi:metabolite-proton symporter